MLVFGGVFSLNTALYFLAGVTLGRGTIQVLWFVVLDVDVREILHHLGCEKNPSKICRIEFTNAACCWKKFCQLRFFIFKGNMWVKLWESTLAVCFPTIHPYALFETQKRVGTWWYKFRVLRQHYPHVPVEKSTPPPKKKLTWHWGKSPCLIVDTSSNGCVSIAMLVFGVVFSLNSSRICGFVCPCFSFSVWG